MRRTTKSVSKYRFLAPAAVGAGLLLVVLVPQPFVNWLCTRLAVNQCPAAWPEEVTLVFIVSMVGAYAFALYQGYRDFIHHDYDAENMANGRWS